MQGRLTDATCPGIQEEDRLRRLLDPVVTSRPRECHDGTREGALKRIENWIDNSDEKNILWISGAPGVGKSALSSTTVSLLRDRQSSPLAVFFIRRQGDRDPQLVWRTIAYQLALSFPSYREHLWKRLREDTRTEGVKQQFNNLIAIPFAHIYRHGHSGFSITTPVVIIDALDEC
ncbi:hypothetical protein SCHPADRAFT_832461, partial [Schizopora paradoxa]